MARPNFFDQFDGPFSSQQPTITQLPESPAQQAERQRDDAAANRDDIRTGIQQRGEQRDIGYRDRDYTLKLRDAYEATPAVKYYRDSLPVFVTGLKTDNTPQGSNALVYAYAKIMDPGSVVREGEAAGIAQSDTIFGRAYAFAQKQLDNTGTFSPEARAGLLREMRSRMIELSRSYDQTRERYEADAGSFGVNPTTVVGPHDALPFVQELEAIDKREGRGRHAQQQAGGGRAGPEPFPGILGEDGKPLGPQGGYGFDPRTREWGMYGNVTDERPAQQGGYWQSPGSQALSGVNEGIASTLGLPVDIPGAIDSGMTRGINALFGTDLKTQGEAYGGEPLGGSAWWQNRFGDAGFAGPPPTTDTGQFARRTGQSVGAAMLPVGGAANSARSFAGGMLASAGGGAGAATAQQAFPGNPAAEFAGELIGSGGTGLGMARLGQGARQQAANAQVPTVDQLKTQAGGLYQRAEQQGRAATPALTRKLAQAMRQTLRREGQLGPRGSITNADSSTSKAFNLIQQYAGKRMTPTEMQTVRTVIADGRSSPDPSDQRLAKILLDQFDGWARPLVPDFDQARDVASRYLQAQDLEQARELAGARAGQFTGSGFENALRTEYRGLDRNSVKGREWFTPEVQQAIQRVSRGTQGSNLARAAGRFAPTGPVSAGLGIGAPAALGGMVGGPAGALAAGTLAASIGTGGRVAATRMGINNAAQAELIARNGGPLQQVPMMSPETERLIMALALAQQGNPPGANGQPGPYYPNPFAGTENQPRRGLFGGLR